MALRRSIVRALSLLAILPLTLLLLAPSGTSDDREPRGKYVETKLDVESLKLLPQRDAKDEGLAATREKGVLSFTLPQQTAKGRHITRGTVLIEVPIGASPTKISYEVMLDEKMTHNVNVERRTVVISHFEFYSMARGKKPNEADEFESGQWTKIELYYSRSGHSASIGGKTVAESRSDVGDKASVLLEFVPPESESVVRIRNVVIGYEKPNKATSQLKQDAPQ